MAKLIAIKNGNYVTGYRITLKKSELEKNGFTPQDEFDIEYTQKHIILTKKENKD